MTMQEVSPLDMTIPSPPASPSQPDHATGRHSVLANVVAALATQLGMWCFTLVTIIYVPRQLGATSMGMLNGAAAWWALGTLLLSAGTEQYICKRVARAPGDVTALLEPALILRVTVGATLLVVAIIAGSLVHIEPEQRAVLFFAGLAACIWSCIALLQNAIQGLERLSYGVPGNLVEKAVGAAGSIIALRMGLGVVGVAALFALAAGINLLIVAIVMRRRLALRRARRRVDWPTLLRGGLPFFWNTAAITLYAQSLIIILNLLTGNTVTGYFGVAARLFGTSLFIPTALLAALFPVFSRQHVSDTQALNRTAQRSFDILVLLGLPLSVGLSELARPLIHLLYGHRFADAAPIMAVYGAILMATYLNMFIAQLLMAMDRQKVWMVVSTLSLILIVPLGVACILYFQTHAHNGGIGAAVALLITEALQTAIGFLLVARRVFSWHNVTFALRCAAGAAVMGAAIWMLPAWSLVARVVFGAAVYLAASVLLRTVSMAQVHVLQAAMARRH